MATFGYTTIGASSSGLLGDRKKGYRFQCAENGTATSLSWYGKANSGTISVRLGIYSDNGGAPNALLGYTSEITNVGTTPQWWTANLVSSVSLQANTWYWLCFIVSGASGYYYDTGTANYGAYNSDAYSDGFANPFGTPTYDNKELSIYCTYTPGGGQAYEVYVDAISQGLSTPACQTDYGIAKGASVSSQVDKMSEMTFNLSLDAVIRTLADVLVERISGQLYEIFEDAVSIAQSAFRMESVLNIDEDATQLVSAIAAIESMFNISSDAVVRVLAEVSVVKGGEVRVTRLFLVLGDLAIQLTGE
jgi:hypothetical protein